MVIYAVCSTVGGLPLFSRSTDTSDNQVISYSFIG